MAGSVQNNHDLDVVIIISIQTPTRGATITSSRRKPGSRFQSTRPRGARPGQRVYPCTRRRFNPRAREGRDQARITRQFRIASFNPRAREGRDPRPLSVPPACLCFNPRAREGRDRARRGRCNALRCFNPRAREGRDMSAMRRSLERLCFNPRAREGRDTV